jgi:hypothetical protein
MRIEVTQADLSRYPNDPIFAIETVMGRHVGSNHTVAFIDHYRRLQVLRLADFVTVKFTSVPPEVEVALDQHRIGLTVMPFTCEVDL